MPGIPSTALITGGASGLGRAFCLRLASRGIHVVVVDIDAKAGERVVDTVRSRGGSAELCVADVTDQGALKESAEGVRAKRGTLDWLVLCAGDVHVGAVADLADTTGIHRDIEVDLWGTVLCCHVFLPLLARGACVLLISSGFGLMGAAGYAAYCGAKAGVIAFGDALRRELLFRNVRVHVACPGDTDTPMLRRELAEQPEWMKVRSARFAVSAPDAMARRILRRCGGKRFLITVNPEIRFTALVRRYLPELLRNALLDRMFPRPRQVMTSHD
jgi:NAD(P)-dependent dehydrogenase (short-subunit alcohol dehydrogenase family)